MINPDWLDDDSYSDEWKNSQNIKLSDICINECSAKVACAINENFHSRLPKIDWSNVVRNTHSLCYTFSYDGIYYGSAIWSSPVAQNRMKNGKQILELRRLALGDKCPKNTATYVLARMIKQIKKYLPEIALLISYQDNDVHLGTIYKAGNWEKDSETKFIDWGDSRKRSKAQSKSSKTKWTYKLKEFVQDETTDDQMELI